MSAGENIDKSVIPTGVLVAIRQYLGQRPYDEVAALIAMLGASKQFIAADTINREESHG